MQNISAKDAELLKFAIENGMLDAALVQKKIEMQKRKEILEKHPYAIWEGKNGKWYTYFSGKEKGRVLKKRNTQNDIEELVLEYFEKEANNPTISETFTEWNDRKLNIGKISKSTHLRNKQIFDRFYKDFGKKKIKTVSSSEWGDFLEEQISKYELTAKAFSNLKTITRGFLKRAKKQGLIFFEVESMFLESDFSDKDFKVVQKEDYEEVFMDDEFSTMINYLLDNLDVHNIGILLMFITGIRVGELVSLKYADFSNDFSMFKVRRTETRFRDEDGNYVCEVKYSPKTLAGMRTVIIPRDYCWILKELRKINPFGEYAFMKDGHRLNTQSIRMRMARLCKKLGIYPKSPHKARKTYASILLDNHVDNTMVIGQMGHTSILCTENHYHRNRRNINQKIEVINQIPEFIAK